MNIDIPSLILDQISRFHGWRFYLCLLCVAALALLLYFFLGWNETTKTIMIVAVLFGTLAGMLWQYLHERNE